MSTWPRTCSTRLVETYAAKEADAEGWDLDALQREVTRVFGDGHRGVRLLADERRTRSATTLWEQVRAAYEEKEDAVGREVLRRVERDVMLQIVDTQWKDHLYSLDHLKEGIGLRGYGQRDPLVEYKKESFDLFQAMKERVDEEIVRYLWGLRPVLSEAASATCRRARRPEPRRTAAHPEQPGRRGAEPVRRVAGCAGGVPGRRPRRPGAAAGARRAATTRAVKTGASRRAESRPERSVPVRQRKEVQEMPWSGGLTWTPGDARTTAQRGVWPRIKLLDDSGFWSG